MSIESSVSCWDAISFWFITGGVILAFVGGVASIIFRRYNRQLVVLTERQNRETQQANEKAIAEANARAAEANQIAEQERVARLKLEQSLAPRTLTLIQAMPLIAALKEFAGQKCVFVTYQDDKEAMAFAGQINAVLFHAGWKVEPSKGILAFMLEFNISTMLDPAASEHTRKAAQTFVRVFNEQGVPTAEKTATASTGEPDTILIRVGKKP